MERKIISILLILCFIFIFAGCSDDDSKEQNSTNNTEGTTSSQTKGDNRLIGTWQIVNENGENHTLFSYVFKDEKTAIMAMGNVAYCSELKLEKNKEGKDTLFAKLYYNINGTYIYEISDDGKRLTLTEDGVENSEKVVLNKVADYQFMPDPPKNLKIDERLIGTWKDKEGSGITYTFNENGTMENNSLNVIITYAQFSASDGKISVLYNQGTDVEDSYKYSFDGDVLIIDGVKFLKQ